VRVFLILLCSAWLVAVAAAESEWLDDVWVDHLILRSAGTQSLSVDYSEAFLRDALRVRPFSMDVWQALIRHYHAAGETELVLAALEYLRLMGLGGLDDPEQEAAMRSEWMNQPAIDVDDEERQELLAAVGRATEEGQHLLAEKVLRRMLQERPRDPQVLLDLGHSLAMSNDWALYTALYAHFLRLHSENVDILNNLVFGLRQLGREDRIEGLLAPAPGGAP
jgi:hypothetical protein